MANLNKTTGMIQQHLRTKYNCLMRKKKFGVGIKLTKHELTNYSPTIKFFPKKFNCRD